VAQQRAPFRHVVSKRHHKNVPIQTASPIELCDPSAAPALQRAGKYKREEQDHGREDHDVRVIDSGVRAIKCGISHENLLSFKVSNCLQWRIVGKASLCRQG